jgi:DNA-binding MarR family transcriptional regulator
MTEDHIQSILIARRGREDIFGRELFSEPAWDILLELYAAKMAGRRVSVSELATTIGTPPTTAVRWITALTARGLVESETDPQEPTRLWMNLTADGALKMERLANQWGSAFVSI